MIGRRISRRRFLETGARASIYGAGALILPKYVSQAWAQDLAPGMIGGPTGFDGAERYQYGPDTPEGRAIEAAKAMKAAGTAPERIVLGLSDGSIGQLTQPFPAGAPSIKELWERETGIPIEIVGLPNGQEFTKVMQDISTNSAGFDIYSVDWNRLGDLAESGGIANLDDFVAAHRPEWDDPENGYVNGAQGVSLLNQYRGNTYGVCLDGDFQTWVFRSDLFGDDAEKAAFESQYGRPLAPPRTWAEHSEVAAFFHRPDQGLFGSTDLRNQGWGYTNWYQRYASAGNPNQFLFGDDGAPLLSSEAGVMATQEYIDSLSHHSPDAISWGWPEQYGNFGSGGAAMTCAFSNIAKFLDNPANTGSVITGKMGTMLPPGRQHDAGIVSRSVLWFGLTGMVSSQSQHPEAAYLLLQWLGSARIFAWMSANPGGYLDPFRLSDFSDPLVRETYHDYHMDMVRETVARTVPTINFPGATAFHNALDENLMAALTGAKSAEAAMADTSDEWVRITRRTGEDKIIEAVLAGRSAWPTIVDPV